MIDPDEICTKGLDSITTPNVLWVELGDVNVPVLLLDTIGEGGSSRFNRLDDDIFNTALHTKTLSSNDTLGANSNDRLVGSDL